MRVCMFEYIPAHHGVLLIHELVVIDGIVDGHVAFHGDGNGHEDGCAHHYHLGWVEKVRE